MVESHQDYLTFTSTVTFYRIVLVVSCNFDLSGVYFTIKRA